jgi:hypothetical protein
MDTFRKKKEILLLELKTPSPRRRLLPYCHSAHGRVKGAKHERSEQALDRPSTVALFKATKRGVIAHKKTTFFWTFNTVATPLTLYVIGARRLHMIVATSMILGHVG